MRRNDQILIVAILAIAIVIGCVNWIDYQGIDPDACLVVSQDGEEVQRYALAVDQAVTITQGEEVCNVAEIRDGVVTMIEADCPDHLCMKQRSISKNGQSIICLPNQIVLTIRSQKQDEIDVMVQ